MKIEKISLSVSNAFLVHDKKKILVDCGCPGDWDFLKSQLAAMGTNLKSLAAVVLTHVHFDHCGCAAFLQAEGVPVIASEKAIEPLSKGEQEGKSLLSAADSLPFLGKFLRDKNPGKFPPSHIDYSVAETLDLSEFGIEGEVVATPGHTSASVSVLLANRSALVGDLVMGGILGLPPAWKPNFHPISANNAQALRQIMSMRDSGFVHFHVGHGDTLAARHVDEWINEKIKSNFGS